MNFSCIFYDLTHSRILGTLTESQATRLHWHQEDGKGRLDIQGLPSAALPLGAPCDVELSLGPTKQRGQGRLVAQGPTDATSQESILVDLSSKTTEEPTNLTMTHDPVDLTAVTFGVTPSKKRAPLPGPLRLVLQAEWLQQANGVLDLGPCLAAAFPKGKINSLNSCLQMSPATHLRTGYSSTSPRFERINPPSTGCLNLYPKTMPPLQCGNEVVVLPRHWFQATWSLYWSYEQKRSEKLTVTCPFGPEGGKPVEITLKVRDVMSLPGFSPQRATLMAYESEPSAEPSQPSLWESMLKEALEHIRQDLVERFATITTLKVPLDEGLKWPLGQPVCVQLEQETLTGDIFAKDLYADGPKYEAALHIRSLPPWLQTWQPQNFSPGPFRHKEPLEGLTEEAVQNAEGWVDIDVENDAEEQWAKILEAKPLSKGAVEACLRQNPTRIHVRLKSLRATRCLLHEIEGECKTKDCKESCSRREKESK